ncbi:MAG: Hsp20/alpha crystallin family protein [Pseudomonadota bacterium]
MFERIKRVGDQLGREIGRAWDNMSEGWRELVRRSGDALTRFTRRGSAGDSSTLPAISSWGVLAGEVEETKRELVVRIEVPGMNKADLEVVVQGNRLVVSGEKRAAREEESDGFYFSERAYGYFQRIVPLPRQADPDSARASYDNGVLTVRLKKTGEETRRRLPIT